MGAERAFETLPRGGGGIAHGDASESNDVVADGQRLDQGRVAPDDAFLLQTLHPLQARSR